MLLHYCSIKRYWFFKILTLKYAVMATHSSTLAWKLPWMEKPGGLQSLGSRRVGHNWVTSLSLFTFTHWRRKWQPTPVFLPGKSQRWQSLVGCCLWGHTESDTTEVTQQQQQICCGINLKVHIKHFWHIETTLVSKKSNYVNPWVSSWISKTLFSWRLEKHISHLN